MNRYNVGFVFDNDEGRCTITRITNDGDYHADCVKIDGEYPIAMSYTQEEFDELIRASKLYNDNSYGGKKNRHIMKRSRKIKRHLTKGKRHQKRTNKRRKTKGRRRL